MQDSRSTLFLFLQLCLWSRKDIFALDLYEAGLGEQIEGMVKELFAGPGAVRKTLHKYVTAR